ncbi:MAG: Appr-1-p processing protein [Anaerolineae bacterium]|nr:Appr-1-p processing protein [Anaerolineae bacterium]
MVCNDAGVWPWVGFAGEIDKAWPQAKRAYRQWYRVLGNYLALGTTQLIELEDSDVFIANMIAQRGVKLLPIQPGAVNHGALEQCLNTVANRARYFNASVHLPRLNGWEKVAPIISRTLLAAGIDVTVYES